MRHPRKRGRRAAGAGLLAAVALALLPGTAAAVPPALGEAWVSQPTGTSVRLSAEVDPEGLPTTYRFEYLTASSYEANLGAGEDGFTTAKKAPTGTEASLGSGTLFVTATQLIGGLSSDTAYRWRIAAKNSSGTTSGAPLEFTTHPLGEPLLAEGRGWELVSPGEKNGGRVAPPGSIAHGGVLQAAIGGAGATFSSTTSFGEAQGAPPGSQYLATRTDSGWTTQNLSIPMLSGTYDTEDGVPYRLFSSDLSRALMLNGDHCRGDDEGCPVFNPPLPGSGAPAGFQNYYLRGGGGFAALLGAGELAGQDPVEFEVSFAGATADLSHVVLSSCAALTAEASEVPSGSGCDPQEQNLYLWSAGAGLKLINVLPSQASGTPGAELAARSGAISDSGGRVYWVDTESGNLYLRDGSTTKQVDAEAGGGGSFETASTDGGVAYFTVGGHLWRYAASADEATDLTPSGNVVGVLGASADGARVYYQDTGGLRLWRQGTTSTVAPGAEASAAGSWPPTTGTARVSAAGDHLLFVSKAALTGYDNTNLATGEADSQVFLYGADAASLLCVSCNPTNARPIGPSSLPGSRPNGATTDAYKPRVLSGDGRRAFFDSEDALVLSDTNGVADAYEWRGPGMGSCAKPTGCLSLVSGGRDSEGSVFADASADGSDAFFLTEASLVAADPGSLDLYDARVGGGFPEPVPPIPCEGDSCQFLPSEPIDPTLTTTLRGLGNPKVRYTSYGRHKTKRAANGKRCKGGNGSKSRPAKRCKGKRGQR